MRMSEEEYHKYQQRRGVTPAERTALQEVIDKANAKVKAPLEDQEQIALVNWLRIKGIRFHHSPNGGHRHKATAGRLKAQGTSAGFPDLIVFPLKYQPILFIELKRQKGGRVSEQQQDWLDFIEGMFCDGYPVRQRVCHGFTEARAFIESEGY